MRLVVTFKDRVGIAQEILAQMARRQLSVVNVEVDMSHVYIDAPDLHEPYFLETRAALFSVPGVVAVEAIEMLPGMRQRLHLEALLAAMADPVLAVDAGGGLINANPAATPLADGSRDAGGQVTLHQLLDDRALADELLRQGFRVPAREISVRGKPFLLDVRPIHDPAYGADAPPVGGLITLHAPQRIGERLHALQHPDDHGFDAILGSSTALRAVKERAVRMAGTDSPLMLLGETGTGKELIALACHQASGRHEAPFLALNCAALPESLAESELFGYAPGAFSGAQRGGKPGLLEMADGGSVFLDEVGEMSPYLQAKLLRFLNDGRFRRVGGSRETQVDVRIISATHRNLERMVAEGDFREDLYYRLNVLTLQVPPLRERRDDIPLLAQHFIRRACTQSGRPPVRLSGAALDKLTANDWPGNVRQLQNVIFRTVTMQDRPLIDAEDVDLAGAVGPTNDTLQPEQITDWTAAIDDFERVLLTRLYPHYPSSRRLATRLNTSHTMIANKLRKHRIRRSP
ncbi:sigma 54-interacting transcriptional regulator [Denitromonas ohlonensis]|jgi:TyrR family helix-turn-helix protein|uniref:HTH-type transcriptional regulatory protein TyrR n=2 Tax=Denitromonas TaxID=139331 RepID=A0A557SL95_9RHOO|nr:sigma 54-interacting transcriptional regulator [Denitromonas ohlonensis]TVO67910.1 Fis family transcriptional regulator [Denitromonas ohlonensis]TVO78185.1 Fis family transcriptional regulator [Denitromonas ohlonensis]